MIFHPAKSNPRQPSSYSGATVSKCSTHAQWTQRLETQVGFGKKQRDRFLHWLIADPQDGVIRFAKTDAQRKAIGRVGELYGRKVAGEKIRLRCWREARVVAYAADAAGAAADAAGAAYAAAYAAAARHKARVRQAEKLLELLKAAPL